MMRRHLTRQEAVCAVFVVTLATLCTYFNIDPGPIIMVITLALVVLTLILMAIAWYLHWRIRQMQRELESRDYSDVPTVPFN